MNLIIRLVFVFGIWAFHLGPLAEASEPKPSINEVDDVMQRALRDGDAGVVVDWADTRGAFIDFEKWKNRVAMKNERKSDLNALLFIAFSRSCLFSAQGAEKFLKDQKIQKSACGGVVIFDATHSSIRPPSLGKRYLAGGGMILGVMPRSLSDGNSILYIGVSKGPTKISDNIEFGEVEIVDASFSDFRLKYRK